MKQNLRFGPVDSTENFCNLAKVCFFWKQFLCFHEQKKRTELLLTARFIIMTLALATNARAYARWRAESVCQNARVSNCQRLTVGSLFDWLLEKRFPISSWLTSSTHILQKLFDFFVVVSGCMLLTYSEPGRLGLLFGAFIIDIWF